MELIGKKEYTALVLNPEDKTFIVYVASFANSDDVHPFRRISRAALRVNKTPTTVLSEFFNFADIFFLKLVVELLEYTKINNHVIDLVGGKQPS